MFHSLSVDQPDPIIVTMQKYHADSRPHKLDLGVGVYKDASGHTPIMKVIKSAEKALWEQETTKSYTSLVGDSAFNTAIQKLVLGDLASFDGRLASAATAGGTGAVRAAFELVHLASPDATIWVSNPSWSNHASMLDYLNIPKQHYRFFDPSTGTVDMDGMMADLGYAKAGDVVLLHGCCHNPTGLSLSHKQWDDIIELMKDQHLVPMVDIAYQGFGDGLDEDAYGVRRIASSLPEVLIASSCSKNFGIYRERTGCVIVLNPDQKQTNLVQSKLSLVNRVNYSFPPDHGARLVTMVLNDPELRVQWQNELCQIRQGIQSLRRMLSDELQRQTNSDRFKFIAEHRGMFSMLGLSQEQVSRLSEEFAIYAVSDSRINMAGLNEASVPLLANAVAKII